MYIRWLINFWRLERDDTAVRTILDVYNELGPRSRRSGKLRNITTLRNLTNHIARNIDTLQGLAQPQGANPVPDDDRKPTHPAAKTRLACIFKLRRFLPPIDAVPLPAYPSFANPQYRQAYGNPLATHGYYLQSRMPFPRPDRVTWQPPSTYQSIAPVPVAGPPLLTAAPPAPNPQMPQHTNPHHSLAHVAAAAQPGSIPQMTLSAPQNPTTNPSYLFPPAQNATAPTNSAFTSDDSFQGLAPLHSQNHQPSHHSPSPVPAGFDDIAQLPNIFDEYFRQQGIP